MTDERLKLVLGHSIGSVVVIGLLFVIIRIALGNVQEVSSYGLMPLVVGLSNLAILYGNWAWQATRQPHSPDSPRNLPPESIPEPSLETK